MTDRTIDGVEVHPGLVVWDYDLRLRAVGNPRPTYSPTEVVWYEMRDPLTGGRGSSMDASRMWVRTPWDRRDARATLLELLRDLAKAGMVVDHNEECPVCGRHPHYTDCAWLETTAN